MFIQRRYIWGIEQTGLAKGLNLENERVRGQLGESKKATMFLVLTKWVDIASVFFRILTLTSSNQFLFRGGKHGLQNSVWWPDPSDKVFWYFPSVSFLPLKSHCPFQQLQWLECPLLCTASPHTCTEIWAVPKYFGENSVAFAQILPSILWIGCPSSMSTCTAFVTGIVLDSRSFHVESISLWCTESFPVKSLNRKDKYSDSKICA